MVIDLGIENLSLGPGVSTLGEINMTGRKKAVFFGTPSQDEAGAKRKKGKMVKSCIVDAMSSKLLILVHFSMHIYVMYVK